MNEVLQCGAAATSPAESRIASFPRELLQAIMSASERSDARREILRALVTSGLARAAVWYGRDAEGQLANTLIVPDELGVGSAAAWTHAALVAANEACRDGEARFVEGAESVGTAPIFRRGKLPEAIAILVETEDLGTAREALVVATTHATLADLLRDIGEINETVATMAALLEMLEQLEQAADLTAASAALADQLQHYFDCRQVAVGLWRQRRCRLAAISRTPQFDRYSEWANAIEAAQDEALLRGEVALFPPEDREQQHALRTHQRLSALADSRCVITVPLHNAQDQPVGAVTFFGDSQLRRPERLRFLAALAPQAGQSLDLLAAARKSNWRRRAARAVRGKTMLGSGLLLVMACTALLLPMPYRVKCDCELQPVVRRFVAAPYDAKLAQAMVGPGDLVRQEQILARVDGREMRWELDEVLVDLDHARKKHDAALAKQNVSDAQLAQLEMERLHLRRQRLEHRIANLEIKSPVAGIVLSGDLERTEGAPLRIGETLFEIAPLGEMLVELAIPESEVIHVEPSDSVVVLLDAYPNEKWSGQIQRIRPRAELVDNESVFIAEVAMPNGDRRLRPGMKGLAKVEVQSHPLGWNLFHKPWEAIVRAYHGL